MFLDYDVIRNKVYSGQNKNYSHLIVYLDSYDYTYGFRYVDKFENINNVMRAILSLGSSGMYRIEEVYNYSLDLKEQLREKRSFHIESFDSLESRALRFATRMHEGQTRFDGTPYIVHPKNVLKNVRKYKNSSKHLDTLSAAALLHDTLEDTNLTFYDLVEFFGIEVASLVRELTTDEDLKQEIGKTRYLEIKLKNMTSWGLTLKLCDRLDNVGDLELCSETFRNKYTKETLEILNYLIAHRINILSNTQLLIMKDIIIKLKSIDLLLPYDLRVGVNKLVLRVNR